MSSVENLGALERRLNAFIPQQQIRGEVEVRLKRLGRTAKIHGFRPGKAPLGILQQQYGAQVHREVLGDALQRSFDEAALANSLKVAGYPSFVVKEADPAAEQIEYSATFEVYPEVTVGDIASETVERAVCALSDADVDSTITTLRKQRAVFEAAGRPAQNEDQVRVDFCGKLDGAVFEGGEASDFVTVLGASRLLPDFENAIIGMKAGESKTFDMTFPQDYHGKDVAGKRVTFTISLHAVEAPRLPELDAEFAKSLGVADGDTGKLKAEIRENLEREIKRRLKARNKSNAMELLLKMCSLDAPKALVEAEVQNLVQLTAHDMRERGVKIPQGMSLPPELFAERAQKRVKLGLVLAELANWHDLKAKPEQVKALVREYAQNYEQPEEVVKWHYSDPSRLQEANNLALEDNVTAWVMGVARVADKPVEFGELMGREG
ncbi:MAG: trigger factor [Nitrosomonadales bacterium]|nr:trigger factor [Nitrosomonadales bacterium]